MKTSYVRQFLQRGIAFGGFGPIVAGLVLWCVSFGVPNLALTGSEVLVMVISTYLLAFVQAGASVFNQIEEWPLMKTIAVHFLSLYAVYAGCYLVNRWIPFDPMVLVIFSAIFIAGYAVIWLTVYLCIRAISKRCNKCL